MRGNLRRDDKAMLSTDRGAADRADEKFVDGSELCVESEEDR